MKSKKALVTDYLQTAWNEKTVSESLFSDIFSNHLIHFSLLGKLIGKENHFLFHKVWSSAFPDLQIKIRNEDVTEHDQMVTCSVRTKQTFLNPFDIGMLKSEKVTSKNLIVNKLIKASPTFLTACVPIDYWFFFDGDKISACNLGATNLDFWAEEIGLSVKNRANTNDSFYIHKELNQIASFKLTPREAEVLCVYLCGMSAKQIAELFAISYRTVQEHVGRALSKLTCYSKQQCFELIYEKGLLRLCYDFCLFLLTENNRIFLEKPRGKNQ